MGKFFKDNKIAWAGIRQVQFIVCEKSTSAYYTKLQEKSWYEKKSQKVKADKILNACMRHM